MQIEFNKKGQALGLGTLGTLGGYFVAAVIVFAVGGKILGTLSTSLTADSAAKQIADNGSSGLLETAKLFPTIGLVIGAAVVIGIVMTAMKV